MGTVTEKKRTTKRKEPSEQPKADPPKTVPAPASPAEPTYGERVAALLFHFSDPIESDQMRRVIIGDGKDQACVLFTHAKDSPDQQEHRRQTLHRVLSRFADSAFSDGVSAERESLWTLAMETAANCTTFEGEYIAGKIADAIKARDGK